MSGLGKILVRLVPIWDKTWAFKDQFSIYFSLVNQNEEKTEIKKSQIFFSQNVLKTDLKKS